MLAVGAKEDNIAPPGCVKPLIDAVGSTDREYVELPGGHISLIAGRGASVHCWPKVAIVSCQSPGILISPPLPSGVLAMRSVAPVFMLKWPASTIGQW